MIKAGKEEFEFTDMQKTLPRLLQTCWCEDALETLKDGICEDDGAVLQLGEEWASCDWGNDEKLAEMIRLWKANTLVMEHSDIHYWMELLEMVPDDATLDSIRAMASN